MKVIIKKPGNLGYEKDIPNTLEALQAEVGGPIEVVRVNSRLVAVVNEEGRLMGLPPQCAEPLRRHRVLRRRRRGVRRHRPTVLRDAAHRLPPDADSPGRRPPC